MNIREYISSGIVEQYIMGLCSAEEEAQLILLRHQYPELNEAIIQYEKEWEKNWIQNSIQPNAATDNKVLQQIDILTKKNVVEMKPSSSRSVKKMKWFKPVAAAAILLLGISVFYNYQLVQKNKNLTALVNTTPSSPLPLTDYNIITSPSITPVAMYGQGTHSICRCTMFWDKKTGKAYIMIHHLPQTNEVKDFQLWAEVDGKIVSVGIIDDSIRGKLIEVQGVPANSIAFTVTLEKAGGSNTPTTEETYLKGKI